MKKYLPESVLLFAMSVFFASSLLSDFEVVEAFLIKGLALLTGLLAFLFIAVDRCKISYYKISVFLVVCIFAGIYAFSYSYLFRCSVKFYIYRNRNELMEMNKILLSKSSVITIHKSRGIMDKDSTLNVDERKRLVELMKTTQNYWIGKYDDKVDYELSGFVDNRYGIIYSEKELIDSNKEKMAENWYLYFFPH